MILSGAFPKTRLRRNRNSKILRNLVREHSLQINDLVLPVFITEGKGVIEPIKSMPGVNRLSLDKLLYNLEIAIGVGLNSIILFPCVRKELKTLDGDESLNEKNLICSAIRKIKLTFKNEINIFTDIALDPYTSHGHDGVLCKDTGNILNDKTVDRLSKQALIHAQAGSDIISPSDMMDGRVLRIRETLDKNNFYKVGIMSYSAKFASAFYGPFRDAIGSRQKNTINKCSYQLDPSNINEALREVYLDIQEGSDIILIKPGMPYLDVIKQVKEMFGMPTFSYQVSGEYSMIKVAAMNKYIDNDSAILESLLCFKRAGCDAIITYFAIEAAKLLKESL